MIPSHISLITLGTRDHGRLRNFYSGLGWSIAFEVPDDVTVFETQGVVLSLFPLDKLAADANTTPAVCEKGLRGITIAINVESRERVDETIDAVRAAGGSIVKEPVDAEWGGRTSYFTDPEENYWEIAWVPPDSRMAAAIRRAAGQAT
jgi:predicted lactoylglutathione lyase